MASYEGSGGSLDWSEAKLYINDIITLYEKDTEETKILDQIKKLQSDIAALATGRETDAKKIIQELQARLQRADAHAGELKPSIEDVQRAIQQVEMQKAKLLSDIEKMAAAKDRSASSLQSLTQQMAAIKHASQALMADHTSTVPRVRYSLSLYATISSIRWNYDNTETLSGYIAPPNGAAVRPFDIDTKMNTDKAVADYLWSKIGEATGVSESSASAHVVSMSDMFK